MERLTRVMRAGNTGLFARAGLSIHREGQYAPAMRKTLSPLCAYVQIDNDYARDRISRTESRLVMGSRDLLERAKARSEDSKKPNTSYAERLNLFMRRACCYLQRRTTSTVPKELRSPR